MTPTRAAVSALLALAVMAATAAPAYAEEGRWLVRARAVHLDPANKDGTGLDLSINSKTMPELDISYFVTPNVAAELVLTYPQKQDLRAGGATIGTLKHLPPTLTLQYHFLPRASVRPYVGAGVNYTRFSDVDLPAGVDIDRNSWGPALQAGFDVPLSGTLSLNVDVKKLHLRTDVSAAGTTLGRFKIDPVLLGVGLGWRF